VAVPSQVIYTHGGGRLGNQIMRFAHWMAWAREQAGQVEVLNLAFWPHADFFAVWREHPACVFPVRPHPLDEVARWRRALPARVRRSLDGRGARAVQALAPWWPGAGVVALDDEAKEVRELAAPAFAAAVTARRRTFGAGWRFAAWDLLRRHEPALRGFFRPARDYAAPAEAFIRRIRRDHGLVIGVLIRQSDYRTWHDGDFFFPTTRYAQWIGEALDLHAGSRPACVVASEERQDPAAFAGRPVYQASGNPGEGGHWFENWVELSLCDLIISAPSTFAATAAFQGGVALWPVTAADQVLARDQILPDGMIGAAHHTVFSLSVR